MKQRIISAAVVILICIYPLLFGGFTLNLLVLLVGTLGCYEFINCIKKPLNYLLLIIMEAVFLFNFFTTCTYIITSLFIEFLLLFIIAIYNEKVTINDVFGITSMSLVISYCISLIVYLYAANKGSTFFYILIASLLTDTGAYFVGRKYGKHKLNERVSPKKTIEGSIGGVVFGLGFSLLYAYFNNFLGLPVYFVIVCSLLLPIISEFGDLAFSLIKRNYGIKDFGNIMPGHGGVLDRIDSVIFCLLMYAILSTILL